MNAAKLISTKYSKGQIEMTFQVFIPDRTISGDYRHEFTTVSLPCNEAIPTTEHQ